MMERQCVLKGTAFFKDQGARVVEDLRSLACSRGKFISDGVDLASISARGLLSPGAVRRLQKFEELPELPGRLSDISQVPRFGVSGPSFPTLTKNSMIWNHELGRSHTSWEGLLSLGIPVIDGITETQCFIPNALSGCSQRRRRCLAGNSQHLAAVLSFTMYCLCHLVWRSDVEHVHFVAEADLANSALEDDEEAASEE